MKRELLSVLAFCAITAHITLAEDNSYISEIANLDLRDLMNQEVTSVLRKEQSLSKAASAVYVINQEDIRRSGSRSIPELLRMVPGITVIREAAGMWSVTARGFDSNGSSKLLVLIDGRSVYSPVFSGVFWDVQNVIAEDIERIEVIRGPGAVSWGENAVNGVINIITKKAKDTQGTRVIAGMSNDLSASTSITHGDKIGEDTHYRIFGRVFRRDSLQFATGEDADDNSHLGHGGFRVDSEPSTTEKLTIQGDIYNGENDRKANILTSFNPPFVERLKDQTLVSGGNILMRYSLLNAPDSEIKIQSYYDRTNRKSLQFGENRDTYDLDFQHHITASPTHDFVYGADFRVTADSFDDSLGIQLSDRSRTDTLFNTFVQDEITIIPDTFNFIPGLKLGYNDYSQFDYQPAAKFLWTPTNKQTIWTSASRAIRSPARIDEDVKGYGQPVVGPNGVTQVPALFGTKRFDAERLYAYELGYRSQLTKTVSVDIASYYHDYQDLLSADIGDPFFDNSLGSNHLVLPFYLNNNLHGSARGIETYIQWKAYQDLELSIGYSHIILQFQPDKGTTDIFGDSLEKQTPQNQATFKAHLSLSDNLQLNAIVYYVDSIPTASVDSYIRTDLHLGYQISDSLLLDIAAQNLTSDDHREADANTNGVRINHTFYGKLTYTF